MAAKKKALGKTKKTKNTLPDDSIISVIVVTHDDEDIIKDKLVEINKTLSKLKTSYEVLVVDNGSSDNTTENIRSLYKKCPQTRALVLSKKYPIEVALTAGLDNCVGDYAILFNIYTDPPSIKLKLIDKLLADHDIVVGKFSKDVIKRDPASKFFIQVVDKISSHEFRHSQNYLIALNRKAINAITRTRRKSRNFSYIHSLIGFKKCDIHYKPLKKFSHKLQKETIVNLLFYVMDIAISNSFKPIRIVSFLGILGSFLYLLYVFFIVILVIFFGKGHLAPQGWISTSTVMSTLFFLLFSLLALISEYIIRVITESRDEPFYFVADELDKSVILKKDNLNIT